ncbi:Gfo/Idh/MocA family protein [Lysinibacillus xylanilyticus]|uniref:Gfo/Idh/MocA family protein n=1 Tax=Lysinibacillus xylanilyticus TaxID=582475 RepID=UPI003D0891F1
MKNAILIGVGGFGKVWREAIQRLNINIAAIVDVSDEALNESSKHFNLISEQCYYPSENWEKVDANFVLDCSPFRYHYENTKRAFENGKHVLSVKPLTGDLKTAIKMVHLQEKYQVKGMVAQQKRYYPVFKRLKEILGEGIIGKIEIVKVEMYLSGLGWMPGHEWRSIIPQPILYEAAIHHFDIFQAVFNSPFTKVFCHSFNPSWSPFKGDSSLFALLKNEQEMLIRYEATFAMKEERCVAFDSGWVIEGTKGVIRIEDGQIYVNGVLESKLPASPPLDELNCIVLEEFLHFINKDTEHGLSFENNLNSLIPLFCCIQSIKENKWIDVKNYTRSVISND